jgi:hypothetical protein
MVPPRSWGVSTEVHAARQPSGVGFKFRVWTAQDGVVAADGWLCRMKTGDAFRFSSIVRLRVLLVYADCCHLSALRNVLQSLLLAGFDLWLVASIYLMLKVTVWVIDSSFQLTPHTKMVGLK